MNFPQKPSTSVFRIGIILTALPLHVFLLGSCGPSRRTPPGATSPSAVAPAVVPDNPISDIAQREILRRQDRIRRMDEAALEANRALSENDLEGAVGGFREAAQVRP